VTKGGQVIQGCSLGAGERVLDSGKVQVYESDTVGSSEASIIRVHYITVYS
jgi:hypothetical protein